MKNNLVEITLNTQLLTKLLVNDWLNIVKNWVETEQKYFFASCTELGTFSAIIKFLKLKSHDKLRTLLHQRSIKVLN